MTDLPAIPEKKDTNDWLDELLGRKDPAFDGQYVQRLPTAPQHHKTIVTDRWDDRNLNDMRSQMGDLDVGELTLGQVLDNGTAGDLWSDTFHSINKFIPVLRDKESLHPTAVFNHAVMQRLMDDPKFDHLRDTTIGDLTASALATIDLRTSLEQIIEDLREEQDLAEQVAQMVADMMAQMAGMGGDPGSEAGAQAISNKIQQMLDDGDEEGAGQLQDQVDEFMKNQEELAQQLAELAQQLADQAGEMDAEIAKAVDNAIENRMLEQDAAQMWGLDPGSIQRLPPEERLRLAREFDNPKLREIAKRFGAMKRVMYSAQSKSITFLPHMVTSVTTGNDIAHVLSTELGALRDPRRKRDFMRRYATGELLQYEMHGVEVLAEGSLILAIDESSSMMGEPEYWSKAVALALLDYCKTNDRPYTVIHYSGPGAVYVQQFPKPKEITMADINDIASHFIGGGTEWTGPLNKAVEILEEETEKYGACRSDVIFLSDGYCNVTDEWRDEFKATMERLGSNMYGVHCNVYAAPETPNEAMESLCKRVITVEDLSGGRELSDIFAAIDSGRGDSVNAA